MKQAIGDKFGKSRRFNQKLSALVTFRRYRQEHGNKAAFLIAEARYGVAPHKAVRVLLREYGICLKYLS